MEIHFYPYDFDYRIEENKVFVYLYSRLDDGQKIVVKHRHRPYFYADLDKDKFLDKLYKLEIETERSIAKVVDHEEVEKGPGR